MLKFCLRFYIFLREDIILHQTCLFQDHLTYRAEPKGEQHAARKTEKDVEYRRSERSYHRDHHKEEHTAAQASADGKPCLLLCCYADQREDGNEHQHEEHLCQHTHHDIACIQTVESKGEPCNRTILPIRLESVVFSNITLFSILICLLSSDRCSILPDRSCQS